MSDQNNINSIAYYYDLEKEWNAVIAVTSFTLIILAVFLLNRLK